MDSLLNFITHGAPLRALRARRLRYNYIRTKYGDKAELLISDTDSLMYQIETDDFYHDIASGVKKPFDTSDYPEKHESGIKTGVNKKVIGKFKDEAAGKQITHFVSEQWCKKAKGIKKNVIKKKR